MKPLAYSSAARRVDTPAIPAGGTATVSVQWRTVGVKGEHTIRVTAETNLVAESEETNNAATLAVTVKGNKVTNGSFEQSNADGSGPAAWSGSNAGAGYTSWRDSGSDGSRGVSISGKGGNALFAGSPEWTSDAIAVTPGEVLNWSSPRGQTGRRRQPPPDSFTSTQVATCSVRSRH